MQGLLQSVVIVYAVLLICINAQKPFYASGNRYPGVLPQNLPSSTEGVDNRFNGDTTTPLDPYAAFEKDPKYNVDKELLDRIKTYPRDKQPFWYLNAEQLNYFKSKVSQNVSETTTQTRLSSFN